MASAIIADHDHDYDDDNDDNYNIRGWSPVDCIMG